MTLCDIGNTHFHFKTSKGVYKYTSSELDLDFFKDLDPILYISVSRKNTQTLLSLAPHAKDISHLISISTHYKNLGIDRKANCLSIAEGIIIDAGSAITIDIMKNSTHLGGYILPGLFSYAKMFTNISSALNKPLIFKDLPIKEIHSHLPQNTQDAMTYGVMESILVFIQNLAKNTKVILTGGDGKYLYPHLKNATLDEDLTFKGMELALKLEESANNTGLLNK